MTSHTQISTRLAGRSVHLHGIPLRLEDLCGANLIIGSTGSGKTETLVEPLALALAAESAMSRSDRAAIIWFAAKGSSHERFLEKLPPERRNQVIRIGGSSGLPFPLFHSRHWPERAERTAVVTFLQELSRHASSSPDLDGNHKAWFEGVLESALLALSEAVAQGPVDRGRMEKEDPAVARLFHWDGLTALIRRIEAAIDYTLNGPGLHPEHGVPASRKECIAPIFERWLARLAPDSQRRIRAILPHLSAGGTANGGFLLGEFSLLSRFFRNAPARDLLLCGKTPFAATWERVIDEGLVVIVDLPSAGSQENRYCLIALAQSLMSTLLRRPRATTKGVAINQARPVVLVADEFHGYLCSRGRHAGLDLFLGGCREFGAIVLLATQSVSQLQGVYGDWARVESVLGHVRHAFIGHSACALTIQWAERFAGTRSARTRPLMIDWHRDPAIGELVDGRPSEEPRVSRRDLAQLRTGIFCVRCPDGRVIRLDARRDLPAPRLSEL